MKYSAKKKFLSRVGLVLLLVGIIWSTGSGLLSEGHAAGRILPAHYPDQFSGHGCINRIKDNEVVIDDRLYRFAPDATYHTLTDQYTTRSRFRVGTQAGFVKNDQNKIESLWYIDKCY